MSKHFAGGGPQKDGEDPHFPYGKEEVYPGNNFSYHVIPFVKGALAAHTAAIMPYYGIPMDQTPENVAFAFNKYIITDLLRDSLKFDGVVCTDWNIITDSKFGEARAWGVEDLPPSNG
jgi:beta-glucosidase